MQSQKSPGAAGCSELGGIADARIENSGRLRAVQQSKTAAISPLCPLRSLWQKIL